MLGLTSMLLRVLFSTRPSTLKYLCQEKKKKEKTVFDTRLLLLLSVKIWNNLIQKKLFLGADVRSVWKRENHAPSLMKRRPL